ncbi:MAG: hypothetical protein LBG27_10310 [Spirochaetaceae bacterium]|jgi:hypothetical protein|nr:hypothetical protein [Spirochaetaceae bacterium]
MADNSWSSVLKEALDQRYAGLSGTELPKLRGSFRQFYTAYSTMYNILLNKGTVKPDPYKNESKVTDLVMPEVGPFSETKKHEQFSLRLANYDNQLDYIVNFYTLSVETLTQDKVKILLAVVKFIDWPRMTPDSSSPNTQAMADIVTAERQHPTFDPLATKNFGESLKKLEVMTKEITCLLKEFSDYNRESYKAEVRDQLISNMQRSEMTILDIKKKFPSVFKGRPFYAELIEEILKEDFSPDALTLQKKVLKSLEAEGAAQSKEKAKEPVSFKPYLIEGLNAIGSAGMTLGEIFPKIESNHKLYQNKKKSLGQKIKEMFAAIINKEPEPVIYSGNSTDPNKNGGMIKETISYNQFRDELEKKSKILRALAVQGSAVSKLESMEEPQLSELLDRNIRDMQIYHRKLSFLDEFFKSGVDKEDKGKVRGIKPELSTIKNAVSKATSKKHDYMAAQEEAVQFKKLGIGL